MFKRIVIVLGFIAFFGLMAACLFFLQKKGDATNVVVAQQNVNVEQNFATDEMHVYSATDISGECLANDQIFCAVERVVKCTMQPDLDVCTKESVPAFVVGNAEDTERPTEMSFKVIKIKPIPDSQDISVYTESDCNAMWFGLCKGTVVYSLTPSDENGQWRVTNIFALE